MRACAGCSVNCAELAEPTRRRAVQLDADGPEVPLALARLHRELGEGTVTTLQIEAAQGRGRSWTRDVVVGGGFEPFADPRGTAVRVRRLLTLPDTVGPGMRMLVCGLNPSVHAARMGVGFGRPGNRFWPAALAAGVVSVDRDPDHALLHHGLGMTDLVKRATGRAAELDATEYAAGLPRVERLVKWLEPALVCVVGLSGWRTVVDPRATAGPQGVTIGGRPVYLMPSTSGLNAHARLEDLTRHLAMAWTRTG